MQDDAYVLSFVMAGGRGSRLKILTKDRSKAAVTILGHYRIFDFVATNIENSGIPVMTIATQFGPETLTTHIGNGDIWGFDGFNKRLEIFHPHEHGRNLVTFEGTADSVRKNVDRIDKYNPNIVLILGGDHIYYMNYKDAILWHEMSKADITIMTNVVPEIKAKDFGIVKIDESGRIIDFAEKPTDKHVIENFRLSSRIKRLLGINETGLDFLASMGNYIFFWNNLKHFLCMPGIDFGKDIIPAMKANGARLYAYVFNDYWRDVGRIQDYFDCNMNFIDEKPPIDLLKNQIRTHERHLPSVQIARDTSVQSAILSPGDVINRESIVTNSVIGYQSIVEEDCHVDHCIFLGASRNEYYNNRIRRGYTTLIGKGSRIRYAILDKNIWIGDHVNIDPDNGTPEERQLKLQSIGLKPYKELDDGTVEGDFTIDPDTGILVIGRQYDADPKTPILPSGLVV